MRIYADVLGLPLHISCCTQAPALGASIYAAAAAGVKDIYEMVETMGDRRCRIFEPNSQNQAIYDELYGEYKRLHDYFGKGENAVMERLRKSAKKRGNHL